MVLGWRNHPKVREWMLHQNEISLDEHLCFIESLKSRADKCYFLVKQENKYIGVIDFTDITEESAELGIYANPDIHGVGGVLMEVLIDYAFTTLKVKKLVANVFSDNVRAKHLYEKFDFTEIERSHYSGREMIIMELRQ
jgi:UDP-4-amino-4,6-dideoxy-N-acetyl-beta-L-altrosamine N-acetyltransferase